MNIRNIVYAIMTILCSPAAAMAAGGPIVSARSNLSGATYLNPIIHADYSDPDVVASPDGKTFYMTASSFQCVPGLPILKSQDLVNWEIVNYALPAVPPEDFYDAAPRHGKGVWAPSIRYHDGEYYIYWGDPDFGIYMIKASDPEGKWSEPHLVKGGKGMIDPTPLWDDDGRAYLANGWAASRTGFNSVLTISEMSPDGKRLISEPRIVFDGNDGVNHTVEGPKLYKRDGYYYILCPAGGVVEGWQLALRAKEIYGPYSAKIVMAEGKSGINGPHQGGWVADSAGEDWFIHFQDKGAYGRVIHLNPMEWKDGWPVIGDDKDGDGCGDAVRKWRKPKVGSEYTKELADREDAAARYADSPLLYNWHGNYNNLFGFPGTESMMRVYGHKVSDSFVNLWEVPNMWLQKFPAEKFSITSDVRISAKSLSEGVFSGIIVMGWDYACLGLEKRGDGFILKFVTCNDAEQGGKENVREIKEVPPTRTYSAGLYPNLECDIFLRVSVSEGGGCVFSYSLDGKKFTEAGEFKARAGKWIGAKAGFFSITPPGISERGWIDVKSSVTEIM